MKDNYSLNCALTSVKRESVGWKMRLEEYIGSVLGEKWEALFSVVRYDMDGWDSTSGSDFQNHGKSQSSISHLTTKNDASRFSPKSPFLTGHAPYI